MTKMPTPTPLTPIDDITRTSIKKSVMRHAHENPRINGSHRQMLIRHCAITSIAACLGFLIFAFLLYQREEGPPDLHSYWNIPQTQQEDGFADDPVTFAPVTHQRRAGLMIQSRPEYHTNAHYDDDDFD